VKRAGADGHPGSAYNAFKPISAEREQPVSDTLVLTPDIIMIWIVVGATVGWLADAVTKNPQSNLIRDMILAVLGAGLAGYLFAGADLPVEAPSLRAKQFILSFAGAAATLLAMLAFERVD
jgi:uncharacterized membrane protein YeaQ/YmgE (transglycosylase-associated protein family)